jgi:hypothetical protein
VRILEHELPWRASAGSFCPINRSTSSNAATTGRQRGNDRQAVFFGEEHYARYRDWLGEAAEIRRQVMVSLRNFVGTPLPVAIFYFYA